MQHSIFVIFVFFFNICNSVNRIMREMVHSQGSLLVFTVSWDWFCIDRWLVYIHRLKYVQLAVSWTAGWCKAFYPQRWGLRWGWGGGGEMFGSRRDLLNRFYTGVVIGLWASSQINTGPKLQPVGWNSPQFSPDLRLRPHFSSVMTEYFELSQTLQRGRRTPTGVVRTH